MESSSYIWYFQKAIVLWYHISKFVHAFIITKCFILVRVHPEPILRTLGTRWEYTLHRIPVHHRAPCTHTLTHYFTPRSDWEYTYQHVFVEGNQKTCRKPIQIKGEYAKLHTNSNSSLKILELRGSKVSRCTVPPIIILPKQSIYF